MNHYEICISVHLNKVSGLPTKGCSISNNPTGDAVLYGILPDQAAVDEIMKQLYAVGMELILANTRSNVVSEIAQELKFAIEPKMIAMN